MAVAMWTWFWCGHRDCWSEEELKEKRGIQSWNIKGFFKFSVGYRHPTSLCKHIMVSVLKQGWLTISGLPHPLFPRAVHPCAEHQRVTWTDKSSGHTPQLPSRCTLGFQTQSGPHWCWDLLEFGSKQRALNALILYFWQFKGITITAVEEYKKIKFIHKILFMSKSQYE